jgi:hypothetical protein
MGPAQPPRHRARKKAKLFSAQPDLKSKRSAGQSCCSMIIILSTITTPRYDRDQTWWGGLACFSLAPLAGKGDRNVRVKLDFAGFLFLN